MKERFRVVKEGLAVGRLGIMLGDQAVVVGEKPIQFETGKLKNAGLNAEEFLVKPFRLLSKVVTPYRFFDFTQEDVLRSGVSLFEGLTVYANHNADVNQWKGFTSASVWDGKNKPNGINALLILDRTTDPKLARGVELGALRSASVTIWFEYEKSHPTLRNFYDHLGEEVDGEVVRFIITRLVRAGEVSIVWEGEDPYAKALEAGENSSKPYNKRLENARNEAAALYKAFKGNKTNTSFIENVIRKASFVTALELAEEYREGMRERLTSRSSSSTCKRIEDYKI